MYSITQIRTIVNEKGGFGRDIFRKPTQNLPKSALSDLGARCSNDTKRVVEDAQNKQVKFDTRG